MMSKPQPMQDIYLDHSGVARFRRNSIVAYLLDQGPFDMNHLAIKDFPDEDREQFAQMIGYSVSGAGDLSYFSDETIEDADAIVKELVEERDK